MSWFLLTAALAATDPVALVAGLFPTATVTEVDGQKAIAPITRKGQVGYILTEDVSAVPVSGNRLLLAFQLDTTAAVEPSAEAITQAVTGWPPSKPVWTRVFQVALVTEEGVFIAKPEGYPLEQEIRLDCMGDFCDFGKRGELLRVKDSEQYAVIRFEPNPESLGSVVPLKVDGDAVLAFDAIPSGGESGGLSGCGQTQKIDGFRESKGALKAVRMRKCNGEGPECEEICDYPMETTLTPITVVPAAE